MWGGRFSMSPAEIMEEINASIGFDKALAPQDIRGSKAHAAMLAEQGIITKADAREISKGLDQVLAEIEGGNSLHGTGRYAAPVEETTYSSVRLSQSIPIPANTNGIIKPILARLGILIPIWT